MEADWAVALAADDPMVTVPWTASDEEGQCCFVDLRGNPQLVAAIPEAQTSPPLRQALFLLNSADSPVWTAKCDFWLTSDEPHDPYEMDAEPGQTGFVAGSYIDLLAHDPAFQQSFALHEQWLRRVTEQLRSLAARASRVDMVLRAARVEGQTGFAISLFVEGCGATAAMAKQQWSNSLTLVLPAIIESLQTGPGERYNHNMGE
jgi:hypothetical protein